MDRPEREPILIRLPSARTLAILSFAVSALILAFAWAYRHDRAHQPLWLLAFGVAGCFASALLELMNPALIQQLVGTMIRGFRPNR
jgi:hypothetical protein